MMESFEQQLQSSLFKGTSEKTFIDKILDKGDIEITRALIKKPQLSREDLLEILHMCSSAEIKLWNLGEWDRYALTKFFVWIREFVKLAEMLYDYKEDLAKKADICKTCKLLIATKTCKCNEPIPTFALSKRAKQTFDNVMRLVEHDIKFLVDLYFNMGRSSLSLKATGFLELLKSKFEFAYPTAGVGTPLGDQQKSKKSMLRW